MGLVMWASSSWAGGRFGAGVFLSQCNVYWPAEHGIQAAIPQSIAFSIYGSAGHGTFSQLREKADPIALRRRRRPRARECGQGVPPFGERLRVHLARSAWG
jgi:hypothetical protein